jgi:hypothetical protein
MRQLHMLVEQDVRNDAALRRQLEASEIKIPTLSAFTARMCPPHPSRTSALRYSGDAGIKWVIQRRTLRNSSIDAHYNNSQGLLLREFVLWLTARGVTVLFVSDDDKCKISIGLPGQPQTAATRSRRVLAGAHCALICYRAE